MKKYLFILAISFLYSNVTDIDGNVYQTVQIGNQLWMAENLKVTHYNNGEDVEYFTCSEYGLHYKNTVFNNNDNNVCPDGWHVPSQNDYQYFIDISGDWMNAGWQMMDERWLGDNSTGFSALPGGFMYPNGNCGGGGTAYIWTSECGAANLDYGGALSMIDYSCSLEYAFSIRCIQSIEGCTNPYAPNFDETANVDDGTCLPATLNVPENFNSIQAAIDYSIDGDTILVSAGTYYENINFNGKNISVIGEDRETTIIDGNNSSTVLLIGYNNYDNIYVSNLTIQNSYGPAVYLNGQSNNVSASFENLIFTNNNAYNSGGSSDDGGGIHAHWANISLNNITFNSNTANGKAGAIFVNNGDCTLSNSVISNNSANHSGAIYANDSNVEIVNSLIEDNISNDDAGGIFATSSNFSIDSVRFISNTSQVKGGAIFSQNSQFNILNTLFYNNSAPENASVIITQGNSNLSLDQCTIIGNSTEYGSIKSENGGEIDIKNSIIRNNNHSGVFNGQVGENPFFQINYSNLDEVWLGSYDCIGCINENPNFTDEENGDFSLQLTSPCIDAGNPNSLLDPDGTRADIGAYPFFQIPGCIDGLACNYDSDAHISDGSCDYGCYDNGDYSLSFDGVDDYVDLKTGGIETEDSYTQEIIFKYGDSIQFGFGDGQGGMLLSKRQNPYEFWASIGIVDDYVYLYHDAPNCADKSNPAFINDNEFHHLTAIKDNNSYTLYLDNQLIGVHYGGCEEHPDDSNLLLGYHGAWQSYFNGLVTEVRMWNDVRTAEEIDSNYDRELNGDEEGLVGYWKFKKGADGQNPDILIDHSGNQNHGTINGATWVENVEGCMDELACNYYSGANISDGSCDYSCHENGNYSLGFNQDLNHDDYVSFPEISPLIGSPNTSFSVYIDFKEEHSDNVGILLNSSNNFDTICPRVEVLSNKVGYYHRTQPQEQYNYESRGELQIIEGDWNNLVYVVNAEDAILKMYLNGILDTYSNQEYDAQINYFAVDRVWEMGMISNAASYHAYHGLIDNLIIFKGSLNQNEINSLINNHESVEHEKFAHYKFNSGIGNILYDHSGNQKHGIINGATWVELAEGCTDSLACNYDEDANTDDGSCEYNADTWYVSTDGDNANCGSEQYPLASIQYAIDSASDGEEVYVLEGTYYENINFNGKNIALIGEDRETTIIDGGQEESVLKVVHGEQNTFISELTLQNGYAHSIISGSEFDHGGGISVLFGSFINIQNCIIKNCVAAYGGGISVVDSSSRIRVNNTLIYNNESASLGGGIAVLNGSDAEVINCNIYGNNSPEDVRIGGIAIGSTGTTLDLKNSIIFNNYPNDIKSWNAYGCYESLSIAYSLTSEIDAGCENYINNNINESPQFIDSDNEDFTLQSTSPCIDAGDPNSPSDPDGTRADIGAYPFQQIQNTIELSEGNNLISFYAIPKDNSLNNVLSSLGGSAGGIIGEGVAASNLNGNWIGSLSSIQPGKGYWLNMEQEGTLILTGIPIQPDQLYELNSGNNLISYPFNTPSAITNVIPDLYEGYFSSFIGEGVAASQIQPGFWVGSLSQLQKNKAYWVRVSQSMDLNFEEPE